MSDVVDRASPPAADSESRGPQEPLITTFDEGRGSAGMLLFILTETILFVMLFFSYFYIVRSGEGRIVVEVPGLRFALPMLAGLLVGSGLLGWGERQIRRGRHGWGRALLVAAILAGAAFLVLRVLEYRETLARLSPRTDAYGSIYYTITSVHAVHVLFGLLMLVYALMLPKFEPSDRPPHRPYHNAALYWYFVSFVWISIVAILYVAPNAGWFR